jgi:hypothetical protein
VSDRILYFVRVCTSTAERPERLLSEENETGTTERPTLVIPLYDP